MGELAATNRMRIYSTGPSIRFLNTSDSFANLGLGSLSLGTYGSTDSGGYGNIITSGIVGIGIATPQFTLSTNNNGTIATTTLRLQDKYLGDGSYGIQLKGVDNGVNGHDLKIQGRTSASGSFVDLVTVKNEGNVGIGEVAPVSKLHVNGDITVGTSGGSWSIQDPTGTSLRFVYGGQIYTLPTDKANGSYILATRGDIPGGTVTNVTASSPIASSGGTTPNITHLTSGVTAGTYNNVTVNTYGHVTSGSNVSYLTAEVDTLATVTARGATSTGDVTINGTLYATAKSFLIKHPTKENMKLRYGSLEGPENGVYIRGKLTDSSVINLPDY